MLRPTAAHLRTLRTVRHWSAPGCAPAGAGAGPAPPASPGTGAAVGRTPVGAIAPAPWRMASRIVRSWRLATDCNMHGCGWLWRSPDKAYHSPTFITQPGFLWFICNARNLAQKGKVFPRRVFLSQLLPGACRCQCFTMACPEMLAGALHAHGNANIRVLSRIKKTASEASCSWRTWLLGSGHTGRRRRPGTSAAPP